jgi:hypothetical protein
VGPWAWRTDGGASPAMTARRRPRELGLRRAGRSVRPTRTRVSLMCARRRFRRAQTAMEVGGAMSSLRGCQWRAVELGRRRCACVRNEWGLAYIVVGDRLRVGDVTSVTGARAEWAAMLGDVWLPRWPMACGGRRVGECGLTTWHPPNSRERHAQEHAGAA